MCWSITSITLTLALTVKCSGSFIHVKSLLYSFLPIHASSCVSITFTSSLYTMAKFSDNAFYRDINSAALLSQLMDDAMTKKWWWIEEAIDKQRWSGWEMRVHFHKPHVLAWLQIRLCVYCVSLIADRICFWNQ